MSAKLKNKMKKIMQDNEYEPDYEDNTWEKINDYYVIENFESIEYTIDKDLIENMKEYNGMYSKILEKDRKDNKEFENNFNKNNNSIFKIFVIYKKDNPNYTINATSTSVMKAIKINLRRLLQGISSNLNIFMNEIENTKIKVLAFVKGVDNDRKRKLDDIKNGYTEKFEKSFKPQNEKNITQECHNIMVKLLDKDMEIHNYDINDIDAYIYELYNTKSRKKYIGITQKKINIDKDKNKLFDETKKYNIKFKNMNPTFFTLNVLSKFTARTYIRCLLEADYYILKDNTIKEGYNENYYIGDKDIYNSCQKNYGIDNLRKYLFLLVQKELFHETYEDENNYDNLVGYIYVIENINENRKYVSAVEKTTGDKLRTLKDIMLNFYTAAINDKNNVSKLLQAMRVEPYYNFKLSILKQKTNRSRFKIENWISKYIDEFDSVKNGYNVSITNRNKRFTVRRAYKRKEENDN
ncbi:hypothetical protein Catovirus_1_1 [Catovirus CTV1]|uniref:Uncharacterized protein n=1 Tax=Catovirus CTV1 TaxID=1977631 RepID=A0A1V0S8B2_9VIRU|nr:hypothetical protein Catovirus_1_1 [Catovirus CTV1]